MAEKYKQKVLNEEVLNYEEAIELSRISNKQDLYTAANEIRERFCGNSVELCSITNAKSGKCSEDCKWCSQSIFHDSDIDTYEFVDEKLAVNEALSNHSKGVEFHSLVTSGRTVSTKTLDRLIGLYKQIAEKSNVGLCASLGLLNEEQLQRLRDDAGVVRYHCNLETAPSYFNEVVSTHTLEDKIETIRVAQKNGLKVCSGGIIGLGESMEQRIELAFVLRDLGIDSIPINILTPIKGTPLHGIKPLTEEEILTTIAMFRFVNPKAFLRLAGGRLQIKEFQEKALFVGINAVLTGDYLTTTGSSIEQDIVDFTNLGYTIK